MMKKTLLTIAVVVVTATAADAQLFSESFSDDAQFTKSTPFFSDGGSDYLGIAGGVDDYDGDSAPSGIPSYSGFSGGFLVGEDLDGEGATLPITLTWSGIDISSGTEFEFSGLFAGTTGTDALDFVSFSYSIDGGSKILLLAFRQDVDDPDTFNGAWRVDTNFDGRGEGSILTTTAQSISATFAAVGSVLDLQVELDFNSGSEEFAMDSLTITAVPEPSTYAVGILGLVALTALVRRRRRLAA